MRSLANDRWGTRRWVHWPGQCMDCIGSREFDLRGRMKKEKRCTVIQWSLVSRHYLFRVGPRYGRRTHSVNRLRWLHVVCVDIRGLWRPGALPQFWPHRCLRRICQFYDGVVPGGSPERGGFQVVSISCRRCLDHRIVVCDTLTFLAPSAVLKLVYSVPTVISLSTMVRP